MFGYSPPPQVEHNRPEHQQHQSPSRRRCQPGRHPYKLRDDQTERRQSFRDPGEHPQRRRISRMYHMPSFRRSRVGGMSERRA